MAHAHTDTYAQQLGVAVVVEEEVRIKCGLFYVCMTFEEAAQLAANLLSTVSAAPAVEQEA